MDDRTVPQHVNGSIALTLEQIDRRIETLKQEIPLYSNKAAQALVQGLENNSYRAETDRRVDELNQLKEERRRLSPEGGTPGAEPRILQPSPKIPVGNVPAEAIQAQHIAKMLPQRQSSSTSVRSVAPSVAVQGVPQQPPQQLTRKQRAIKAMNDRTKNLNQQNCMILCSAYLDYYDHIALACVSKAWRQLWRKSVGWRRLVLNLETTMFGHVGKITSVCMFDPNTIVSGSADGKVKFWDITKQCVCVKTLNITPSPVHRYVHPRIRETRELSGHAYAQNPDGNDDEFAEYPLAVTSLLCYLKFVLIGAEDGRLIVWMAGPEKKEFEYSIHRRAISCMINVQNSFVFTGSMDGGIAAIRLSSYPFNPTSPPQWAQPLISGRKHEGGVAALAFAGGHLFSGSVDGKLFAWNPSTMEFRKELAMTRVQPNGTPIMEVHNDRVTSMVGYDDRLYTASWDSSIKWWNARTLELLKEFSFSPIGICWSLALRRDAYGFHLVAGARDSDVCVIDADTLETVSSCEANHWAWRLDRHQQPIKCIYAALDGSGRIITGSDDWHVKLWTPRLSSSRSQQSPFAGLPPGPLSKEDAECLCLTFHRKQLNAKYYELFQEQKSQYDKAMAERRATLTPEQIQELDKQNAKYMEQWNLHREKYRQVIAAQQGGAAATPGASATATPGATTSEHLAASATPSAAAIETPKASATPGAALNTTLNGDGGSNATPAASQSVEAHATGVPQQEQQATTDEGSAPAVKQSPDENGTAHDSNPGAEERSKADKAPDAPTSADNPSDPTASETPANTSASTGENEPSAPEKVENGGEDGEKTAFDSDEVDSNGAKRQKLAQE